MYKKPRPTVFDEAKPSAYEIGRRSEKRLQRKAGGLPTPGSGNKQIKGDLRHGPKLERMIENKSTTARSMKVQVSWLEKLEKEAFEAGKEPVLVLDFEAMSLGSRQWAMIPLDRLLELYELLEQK